MASIRIARSDSACILSGARGGTALVRERSRGGLAALLRDAQAGDAQAFGRVCARFQRPLLRFVTRLLRGDATAAEDVVQETFVVAWRKLDQVKGAEHLSPWLYQVARYKAISHLRRRGPRGRPMDSLDLSLARGHEPTGARGDPLRRAMILEPGSPWAPALQRALARLPARYAGILRLHYLHGLPTREIGRLLGLTRTTVKMRLLRGRRRLRALVREELQPPETGRG